MVQFRPRTREIITKVVYYGPPLGGKTTNLRTLYDGYPPATRGELVVVPAGGDRTIFFDFLPVDAGTLRGMRMRVQLYTVPGQVHYTATRQVVLRGVDAVVFVGDSQRELLRANRESWENLKENLSLQGLSLTDLPHVLQYNKRDLGDVLSVDDLDNLLNEFNAPFYEAVATTGVGVEETLQGVVKLVARSLRDRFSVLPDAGDEFVEPLPPAAIESVLAAVEPKRPAYSPPVPTFGLAARDVELGTPKPGAGDTTPLPLPLDEPVGAKVFSFAPPPLEPAPPLVEDVLVPLPLPPVRPASALEGVFDPDEFLRTAGRTGKVQIAPDAREPGGVVVPEVVEPPVVAPPEVLAASVVAPPEAPEPAVAAAPEEQFSYVSVLEEPVALDDPFADSSTAVAATGDDVFEIPRPVVAQPVEEPAAAVEPPPGAAPEPDFEFAAGGLEIAAVADAEPHEEPAQAVAELPPEAAHTLVQRIVPRALAQVGEVRELELEVPVPAVWTGGKRITLQFRLTLVPEEDTHAD